MAKYLTISLYWWPFFGLYALFSAVFNSSVNITVYFAVETSFNLSVDHRVELSEELSLEKMACDLACDSLNCRFLIEFGKSIIVKLHDVQEEIRTHFAFCIH